MAKIQWSQEHWVVLFVIGFTCMGLGYSVSQQGMAYGSDEVIIYEENDDYEESEWNRYYGFFEIS